MGNQKQRTSKRHTKLSSNLYLAEPLESRTLLSAGFIFELTQVGPHGGNGFINKFMPSGEEFNGAFIDASPAPNALILSGSDIFVLSTSTQAPGVATLPGRMGEFTTSGSTVNASLIPVVNFGASMALSGTDLFVTLGNGTVAEYTTSGATVHAALISGLSNPGPIAVSGNDLFVQSTASDGTQKIGEYTLSGGVVNASLISGIIVTGTITGLAVIGSDLFVLESTGVAEYTTAGTLVNSSFVTASDAHGFATDGSDLFVQTTTSINEYSTVAVLQNTYPIHNEFGIGLFAVAPAAPVNAPGLHLTFEVQPGGFNLTDPSQNGGGITVALIDQMGELATDATRSVTLRIVSGPAGATLNGTTTVALVDGTATFSQISVSQPGNYTLAAIDGVDLTATSASGSAADASLSYPYPSQLAFRVQPLDVSGSQNTINALTVQVTDLYGNGSVNSATGTVTISIASGPSGATLGGTTSMPIANNGVGFDNLTVSRPGTYTLLASDGTDPSATSTSFVVFGSGAQLTLASSQASVKLNQAVAFTATVAGSAGPIPTGTVTFTDDAGNLLGTSTLQSDGTAVLSTAFTQVGTQTISAVYSGDTTYSPAAGTPVSLAVNKLDAQVTLTSQPAAFIAGQPLKFTAMVSTSDVGSSAPTGTMQFTDGNGNVLATSQVQNSGVVDFSTTFIQAGDHTVTATYSGDGTFTAGAAASITVGAAAQISTATIAFNRAVLPASVIAGAKFNSRIPVVLSNAGTTLRGLFTIRLYAQPAGGIDGSQVLLTTFKRGLVVKSQKRGTVVVPLRSIPATLPAGSYELITQVLDSSGREAIATAPDMLVAIAPFVQPSVSLSGSSPATITPGKMASITVTLTNQGNITGKRITIAISAISATSAALVLKNVNFSRSSVNPGRTVRLKIRYKIPVGTTAGTYSPFATVTLAGIGTTAAGTTSFNVR